MITKRSRYAVSGALGIMTLAAGVFLLPRTAGPADDLAPASGPLEPVSWQHHASPSGNYPAPVRSAAGKITRDSVPAEASMPASPSPSPSSAGYAALSATSYSSGSGYPQSSPQAVAYSLLPDFGFDSGQFACLVSLWDRESGWRYNAEEPATGAYGIPQALPASKMAEFGDDYLTDPATQIKWGLQYCKTQYGSPCGAWDHELEYGWY